MKKFIKYITYLCIASTFLCVGSLATAGDINRETPLNDSIDGFDTVDAEIGIADRFSEWGIDIGGPEELRDFLIWIATSVLIPIFVFVGIVMAILGFYKLMASDTAEEQKIAFNYLLWGTIGIVIMVSAGFIINQLVGLDGGAGIVGDSIVNADDGISGAKIAEQVYLNIVFPLIRIFIYFVLGILFIMAMIHAFKYIFSKDDEFQRKSFTILIYNALGIVVIILAKSMIELVYGKYEDVINENVTSGGGSNVGDIGSGVLNTGNGLGLAQTVINWVLSIATFIVLVLIIYQSYQLLVNPSNEELVTGLRKNIAYTFIGILIIGAGYLLTNFFIIT